MRNAVTSESRQTGFDFCQHHLELLMSPVLLLLPRTACAAAAFLRRCIVGSTASRQPGCRQYACPTATVKLACIGLGSTLGGHRRL